MQTLKKASQSKEPIWSYTDKSIRKKDDWSSDLIWLFITLSGIKHIILSGKQY